MGLCGLWGCGAMALWDCGTAGLRGCGAVGMWGCGTMGRWDCGVWDCWDLWDCGAVVLGRVWGCGTVGETVGMWGVGNEAVGMWGCNCSQKKLPDTLPKAWATIFWSAVLQCQANRASNLVRHCATSQEDSAQPSTSSTKWRLTTGWHAD